MKVSELTGATLDLWVARADGYEPNEHGDLWREFDSVLPGTDSYEPSKNWAHGGPIIEREGIAIDPNDDWADQRRAAGGSHCWFAELEHAARADGTQRSFGHGPTPLIAAMRAFVASKFGEEVPEV